MKIAIDTIPLLSPLTGVGNYTYQIARNLKRLGPLHEYVYFYGYYSQRLISPGENSKIFYRMKEAVRKIPFLGTAARNVRGYGSYLSSRQFDLYFEPNFIPLKIPARHTVVTVLDFSFARFPEWHTRDKIQYFKKHFWKKVKRADRIIVISDFIKSEAVHSFGFSEDQLTTIHLGYDRSIFRVYPREDLLAVKNKYRLPEDFILFVGSIEPRKNLQNLLQAYMDLEESVRKELKLVLVGFKGWENEEIISVIRKLKGNVFYTGYVPDEELAKIYNLASLFVYPSFYEGFGLPPLEAMACGCPVIVSDAASLPEVCGKAALYVAPHDVPSITGAIHKCLTTPSLKESLINEGWERIKLFSWEKCANEHLKVFEKATKD